MTVTEIAKVLGVSKSTVSCALSGKGRISDATRRKILEYVSENGGVKGLGDHKVTSNSIAVVIPADAYAASIPFFQECLIGISEAASMFRYDVLITAGSPYDISGIQMLVEKQKVDAVLLMQRAEDDRVLDYLVKMGFPTGLIGSCEYNEVLQVDVDQKAASAEMMSHLLGLGYSRFATVLGNQRFTVNKERYEGIRETLEKRGISQGHNLAFFNVNNLELLDSMIGKILDNHVECIICGDNALCTFIMSKLQTEGYRIPKDISVVSLHNSSNLECFSPSVTTVSVSAKKMGRMLGKQVINYLQGNSYEQKVMLEYEILFRKSTRKMN